MQAEKRSLAPALVGAIVGAVAGVALQVMLETGVFGNRIEAPWFAVVIGLLTGLGVRQANRHHMERSYLRGAVAGVIALAAIVASSFASREFMKRKETSPKSGAAVAAAQNDAGAADAAADAAEPAEPPVVPPAPVAGDLPAGAIGRPKIGRAEPNPWDFIYIALGGLIAYELGRGIDHSKRKEGSPESPADAPVATDPSN